MSNDNKTNDQENFEKRLSQSSRPPNGQRLTLHSLRFVDVVRVSDYEEFEKGLDRLYQEKLEYKNALTFSDNEQQGYKDFLTEARKAFLSFRYSYLPGFFSKSFADSRTEGILTRLVRELPPNVKSLSFFMCQIIPSSIVVVINVEYDSTVSDSLNALFTKNYSEREEKHGKSATITYPDIVKSETIRDFLSELQGASESFISKYFTGIFLSEKTKSQIKCPSIKLFSLQDVPFTTSETLIAWLKENHDFTAALGYIAVPSWTLQFNKEYLLFRYSFHNRGEEPIHLSLLSSESLFNSPKAHEAYGTAFSALNYKYMHAFDNLMPLLAYKYLLLWHSRRLITYRNDLGGYATGSKSNLRKRYDSMYEAKVRINTDYFDFMRLHQELEEITSPQAEKWLYRETAQFELLENPKNLPHYAKELVSNITFLASNLDKEYSLLNDRYSDLFETMNTLSNFVLNKSNAKYQKSLSSLTWTLVIVTILMTIAVIIQIFIALGSLPVK
jgi:hypothetical protein